MKKSFLAAVAIAAFAMTSMSFADIVNITALDLRGNGAFGHNGAGGSPEGDGLATLISVAGVAPSGSRVSGDPLDYELSFAQLDLDGDGSANDTVLFTLRGTGTNGATPSAFNQGTDTGFGNLNGIEFSVVNVSGTTTDSGDSIVFDGFTGAALGVGGGTASTNTVDINGTTASATLPGGGFAFLTDEVDFALTSTVTFDNSTRSAATGTVVARHFDLQFSTVSAIPEPSSLAVLGLLGGLVALRRRK